MTVYEMRISDWIADVCSSDLMISPEYPAAVIAVERVGDALGDLGVAGDDRGRILGADHRARGNDQLQRLQAALVQRDLILHQGAEDVEHRRLADRGRGVEVRSEEHTSELQSLMRISYAVFCLKKQQPTQENYHYDTTTHTPLDYQQ